MEKHEKELEFIHLSPGLTPLDIPLSGGSVQAGFPSPADDFSEGVLDLNRTMIQHPEATFFVRVVGDSMQEEGIFEGDLLLVDRAVEPFDGAMVVAHLDGEFTLKRVRLSDGAVTLVPANKNYPSIRVNPEADFTVWGVVRYVIKKV